MGMPPTLPSLLSSRVDPVSISSITRGSGDFQRVTPRLVMLWRFKDPSDYSEELVRYVKASSVFVLSMWTPVGFFRWKNSRAAEVPNLGHDFFVSPCYCCVGPPSGFCSNVTLLKRTRNKIYGGRRFDQGRAHKFKHITCGCGTAKVTSLVHRRFILKVENTKSVNTVDGFCTDNTRTQSCPPHRYDACCDLSTCCFETVRPLAGPTVSFHQEQHAKI